MKKVFVGLTILTLISVGAISYAHGPSRVGAGYTHMMGPWYSGHVMGQGRY